MRIKNIFANGVPVLLSFSAGKDSLAIGHLVYQLIQEGEIDAENLTVLFIDEEAIFDCTVRVAEQWRKKFMDIGAAFDWYCLEVRHYNCFNLLESDEESFYCWDRNKEHLWVRQPPDFAIRTHHKLKPRSDNYQSFIHRMSKHAINIVGVRAAESVQRLQYLATMGSHGSHMSGNNIFPIYDWKDHDVWLYLKEHEIDFPEAYLYMWQIGKSKNLLRISQFFSVDSAAMIIGLSEFYPDLWERVIRREPGAELSLLYWDSEMFRRSTNTRSELESGQDTVDCKKKVMDLITNIPGNFKTSSKQRVARAYSDIVLKFHDRLTNDHWSALYAGLIAGDPKLRTARAISVQIISDYAQKHDGGGGGRVKSKL